MRRENVGAVAWLAAAAAVGLVLGLLAPSVPTLIVWCIIAWATFLLLQRWMDQMGPNKARREHEKRLAEQETARKSTARKGNEGASDLESMTVDELAALAETRNVTVTRGDGTDGKPLKADYIAALS